MNIDFIQTPLEVIQSDKITDGDKIIYGIIYYLSQLSDKECWASNKTISEIRKCSPSTVSHAVTRMTEAGFLTVENKTGRKRCIKPMIVLVSTNLSRQTVQPISNKIAEPISNELPSNNIYISNNIKDNIYKYIYKINSQIYKIGNNKTQLNALNLLLKPDVANASEEDLRLRVEHVEHILEWYVKEREAKTNKFLPIADVPTQFLEKWSRIEASAEKAGVLTKKINHATIDDMMNKFNK